MTAVRRSGVVDHELVLDLGYLDAQLLPVAGGKAANLGELIRAGFPYRPGSASPRRPTSVVDATGAVLQRRLDPVG